MKRFPFLVLFLGAIAFFCGLPTYPVPYADAAIQLVGTTTASGTNAAYNMSLTSLAGGIGSEPQENDLVIVVNAISNAANGNPGVGTAGYTEIADLYANDTVDTNLSGNYKIMGSTPDTLVSCNPSSGTTVSSVCYAIVFRGVSTSSPMDVASTTAIGTNSANIDCPSITPTTAGSIVACLGSAVGTSTPSAITWTASYTKAANISTDPGTAALAVGEYIAWVSGATNPGAFTVTGMGTVAQSAWAAITVAIRAATAPTVTTQSASSVTNNNAVLNGNITSAGGATPSIRGFAWGTSSTLTGGGVSTTTETGWFSTGAFTDQLVGLACNTTYYSRAYATNLGGTGFGAISSSFTTSVCSGDAGVTPSRTLRLFSSLVDSTPAPITIFLDSTAGSTFVVPSDWNNSNNTIEVIGGGGSGGISWSSGERYATGGGGGGYAKATNVSLSGTVAYKVGAGGASSVRTTSGNTNGTAGGDTYFCNSTSNCASIAGSAVMVGAKGGSGGGSNNTTVSGGTGGAAASAKGGAGGGTTNPGAPYAYSGGRGGNATDANAAEATGAGGAAGSSGDGDAAADLASDSSSTGAAGDAGAGGAGGARCNGCNSGAASPGDNGAEWNATHGSGGGGGGIRTSDAGGIGVAGNGGYYGGGGGGIAGVNGTLTSGGGADGLIALTYTPTSSGKASVLRIRNANNKGARVFLTSGSQWQVPLDWNSASNTIEVIGGGGSGGHNASGGGGAYSKISNLSLTPGSTVAYRVGAGADGQAGANAAGAAGGDTWFCDNTSGCGTIGGANVVVGAKGGGGGTLSGDSSGGDAASGVGTVTYSGGGTFNNSSSSGGGGGAAGPNGNGANAGTVTGSNTGGAGGGGGGGGSAGTNQSGGSNNGTAGGNNYLSAGSGAGGTVGSPSGVAGSAGAGGGGAYGNGTNAGGVGGKGGDGTEWGAYGSGGGGGAGGWDGSGQAGGNGGFYGGGGGAGTGSLGRGGNGAQGIIVITYGTLNAPTRSVIIYPH